jgi:hypothetical protein
MIVVTSPMGATSGAAPFTLTCDQANITVSLSSTPASPDSVACGSTPPAFTLTGSLTSDQAISGLKYEWLRSNGTAGSSGTISLAAGTPRTVTDSFTPGSDTFTGSDELKITAPFVASESLPIALSCTFPPLKVTTSGNLPSGIVGTIYKGATLAATGGKPPYTWSETGLAGSGLTMSPSGVISGTPTTAGTYLVSVMATDSESPAAASPALTSPAVQLTLVITPRVPQVSVTSISSDPASPVTGSCGDAAPMITVQASLASTAATTVTYHWSRSVGTTTTPQTVDVTTEGATVTDDIVMETANSWNVTDTLNVTAPDTVSKSISLSYSCSFPNLAIENEGLQTAQEGSEYPSQALSATGGDGTYKWSASGLPDGLSLNGDTITGTPTQSGRFPVTVTVTDGESPTPQTASKTLTLSVDGFPAVDITTGSLPQCNFDGNNPGCPSTTLTATGGDGHYTWSASGLPGGVNVSPGGVLSGDPTKPGNYPVTITVKDSESPAMSTSMSYTLVVNDES